MERLGELHICRLIAGGTGSPSELGTLLRSTFPADPHVTHVEPLLDYVFRGVESVWDALDAGGVDALFAEHLRALNRVVDRTAGRITVRNSQHVRVVGQDSDLLANVHRLPESLLQTVNAIANRAITPTRAAAIVTTMRNEGISILEWVAHYRVLGFDGIFVYTNDNIDGSDPLLTALAESEVIHLLRNDVKPDVSPQAKSLNHAVHLLRELRDFEWVFFIDADELLMLAPRFNHSIASFLGAAQDAAGDALSAICLHWRWFGSEKAFGRTEGLMLERFQQGHGNNHVKTIVRLRDALSMHLVHVPTLAPGRIAVTSGFQPCSTLGAEMPIDYAGGQLNHYWNKSFEEFVVKQMRGDGTLTDDARQKDFDTFFTWGQAVRPPEPPPSAFVASVKAEVARLLDLPGVREEQARVEGRFREMLIDYDRTLDLRRLYQSHMDR